MTPIVCAQCCGDSTLLLPTSTYTTETTHRTSKGSRGHDSTIQFASTVVSLMTYHGSALSDANSYIKFLLPTNHFYLLCTPILPSNFGTGKQCPLQPLMIKNAGPVSTGRLVFVDVRLQHDAEAGRMLCLHSSTGKATHEGKVEEEAG